MAFLVAVALFAYFRVIGFAVLGLLVPGLLYGSASGDGWVAEKAWAQLATAGNSIALEQRPDAAP